MAKAKLSVVSDEVAEDKPPTAVRAAADHSERAFLVALRDRLSKEIDAGVPPAYLAPISRQVRDIDREIRSLDAAAKQEAEAGDVPDDEDLDVEVV